MNFVEGTQAVVHEHFVQLGYKAFNSWVRGADAIEADSTPRILMHLLVDRRIPPCGWISQYVLMRNSESTLYKAKTTHRQYATLGQNCFSIINQT